MAIATLVFGRCRRLARCVDLVAAPRLEDHFRSSPGAAPSLIHTSFRPHPACRMVNQVEWLEWRTKTDTTPSGSPGW